ncbi:KTSC domain-containing protein [Tsuneonella deserti]|uniref:KTSC domain-containing protein n=1 Tax=Tsuneonella deserti TaxID=2035528 RepID=UPI001665898D|nr:KTSC domain-containing protein [Tsuneonella deserti]
MPVLEMRASSAIERVAYNARKRELSIWFTGRRRYIYADVPAEVYRELCEARSAGQFLNSAVKGRYDCRCDPPRRRYLD